MYFLVDVGKQKHNLVCGIIHCPASILYKSIAGRYRPVSYPDGPITARYRFIKDVYCVACLFVVLRFYGSVNPIESCRARSVYLTTLSLGRLSPLSGYNQYCAHSFAIFWISGRERMTVESISWSIFTTECCRPLRGSSPWPSGLQSDAHPTEPPRPALGRLPKNQTRSCFA